MSVIFEHFCRENSSLWDTNVTWHTNDPFLSVCFVNTVLIWVPCSIFWILLPLELYWIQQKCSDARLKGPWYTRIALPTALAIVAFVRLVRHTVVLYSIPVILSHVLLCVTIICIMALTLYQRKSAVLSYGVQWWTFLCFFFCCLFQLISQCLLLRRNETVDLLEFALFLIHFFLIICCFILFSCPVPLIKTENLAYTEKCWPEYFCSYPSQLFFCWMNKLLFRGFRKGLEMKHIWTIGLQESSGVSYSIFYKNFKNYFSPKDNRKKIAGAWIMTKILVRSFGLQLFYSALLKLLYDLITFVGPVCVVLMMDFQTNKDEPEWHGYVFMLCMMFSQLFRSWALQHHYHRMNKLGIRIRASVIAAVYRKALNMTSESRQGSSVGEIVNIMAVDASRFIEIAPVFHLLWSAPLQLSLGLYFLYTAVGIAFVSGIGVFIIIFCMNAVVSGFYKKIQEVQMTKKDARLKMLTEILNGMRAIKLYAWEVAFQKRLETIRNDEIACLRKAGYLNGVVEIAWSCTNHYASLAIFTTFILLSQERVLTAQNAFAVVTIFNVMYIPLTLLPIVMSHVLMLVISLRRLGKFLSSDELDEYVETFNSTELSVNISNASFQWESTGSPILDDLNFSVKKGSLIAVVGPVGSGKSSLLSAICGDMLKLNGSISLNGSRAYVPQQAWIQNMTVRENILFDRLYESERYNRVIDCCALRPDFKILAGGDLAEIGERGINLSGGQKQRISLARAVYQNSDIYFLDDPLSAVDVHVGKHIFDKVISSNGLLKDKTRILVTHGVNFLPQCDQVIVLKNGRIEEIGTYQELLNSGGAFSEFLEYFYQQTPENESSENLDKIQTKSLDSVQNNNTFLTSAINAVDYNKHLIFMQLLESWKRVTYQKESSLSQESLTNRSLSFSSNNNLHTEISVDAVGQLIEEEEVQTSSVSWTVYLMYAKAAGCTFIIHIVSLFITQCIYFSGNIWLEMWTDKGYHYSQGLTVYGAIAVALLLSTGVYSVTYVWYQVNASITVHKKLLARIFRAPISFFDTTPTGRIINRFGKDINTVDNLIPISLSQVTSFVLLFLQSIAAVVYATPFYILPFIPLMVCYFVLQKFYINSSRQFRRLEAVSRSPIYSHFQESLNGAASIRAYRQESRFSIRSDELVDANNAAQMALLCTNSWLGVYLDVIGALMVGIAILLSILQRATLAPGEVGLSITFALALTDLLHWGVREIGILETEIVALERIKEYTKTITEASWDQQVMIKDMKSWPSKGVVEFCNYATRYRPGLPLVLHDFSCTINEQEKIGVVGRTGAGKSSLTLALFRLIEPSFGKICIDNVDISQLGLHNLRKKLTIIPQEPILFSGTLRMNIDPFDEYSDSDLWHVLELSHLKQFVDTLPSELSHEIAEGGSNLSVGQRQLICLARALLRKSKILVLDEATAAVDVELDSLIQETIREQFKDCTVITIAHRLNTIMDSQRIMVLDKGRLVEFDTPSNLLQNPKSIFCQMSVEAHFSIPTYSGDETRFDKTNL